MTYKRERETCKPKAVLELMGLEGPSQAARALGVSAATLYKARRLNEVSKVIETAASGILKDKPVKITEKVEKFDFVLLEVPHDKIPVMRKMCAAIGAHESV